MSKSKKTSVDKALDYLYYGALPVAFTAGLGSSLIPSSSLGGLVRAISGGGLEQQAQPEPMIGSSLNRRMERGRGRRVPAVIQDINPIIKPTKQQETLLNTMSSPNNQSGDKSSSLKYIIPASALLAGLGGAYYGLNSLQDAIGEAVRSSMVGGGLNNEMVEERINGKKYIVPTSFNNEVQDIYEDYSNLKRYIPVGALIGAVAGAYLGRNYLPSSVGNVLSGTRRAVNLGFRRAPTTLKRLMARAGTNINIPYEIEMMRFGEGMNKQQRLATADLYLMPTMK